MESYDLEIYRRGTKKLLPLRIDINTYRYLAYPGTKKHSVFEYLDLRKDPILSSIASDHSRMHSQSACDCYCKTQLPMTHRRNEMQSDRSLIKLLTSKSFISKTEVVRSAKKVPLTPAKPVVRDEPDVKTSTATSLVSPVLSPETSVILEDVGRLIKDAEIQIKEITTVANSNRVRKPMNIYEDEVLVDDENDQLLYIRERVAYKFQEANGWIEKDRVDLRSQKSSNEGNDSLKWKRNIDFSAPKFKVSKERYKEFSLYGDQKLGHSTSSTDNVLKINKKLKSPNRETISNKKIDTFTVQAGPSVDIQSELIAQNLEDIHISPDPSFVRENANVGTYMVCHNFPAKNSSTIHKEKFMKILEKDDTVKYNRRSVDARQRKRNLEKLNEAKDKTNSEQVSETAEKSLEAPLVSSNIAPEDDEKSTDNSGYACEVEVKAMIHSEDKQNSTSSNDYSVRDQRLEENQTVQQSFHNDSKTNQETKVVEERINETMKSASDLKNEKQVRFSEEVLREPKVLVKERQGEEGNGILKQNSQVPSKPIQLEDPEVLRSNTEEFKSPSISRETKTEEERIEEKKKKHIAKLCEKEKRYKIIDERFTNILNKYCKQNEKTYKNDDDFVSSNADSSEEAEDLDNLYNFYNPPIEKLDNVLQAYDKMIDNVIRSTKTIEEFLLRPEIEEYRVQSKKNNASDSRQLNRSKIEKKTNTLHCSQTKRNTALKTKETVFKDRLLTTNKHTNKAWNVYKTMQTKTVKPLLMKMSPSLKRSSNPKQRCACQKGIGNSSVRSNLRAQRGFGVPKKLPNEESTELSKSNVRVLEKPEESNFREGNDSSTAFINTLSSSTDTRFNEEAISRTSAINMADEARCLKPDTTSIEEIERKDLQKNHFDYAALYDMVQSDFMNRGFSESKSIPNIVEHLITRVLQEESRFIEDKIKNALNVNQIVSMLVRSLLENLQGDPFNPKTQNLKLLVAKNATNKETTSDASEKQNVKIEHPGIEENSSVTNIRCDGKMINNGALTEINREEIVFAETANNSKNRQSLINNENIRSKHEDSSDRTSKLNSDTVQLEEISDTRVDEFDLKTRTEDPPQNCEQLNTKKTDNDDLDSKKNYLSNVGEGLASEDKPSSKVHRTMESNVAQNENKEIIDKPTTIVETEESKSTLEKDSAVLRQNSSPLNDEISEVKEEKLSNLHLAQDQAKTSNVQQISSSDSLHDCASLQSSSKENNVNKIEQHLGISNIIGEERPHRSLHYDSMVYKEKILSDLYDEVHRKFLPPAFDINHSSTVDQNYRWSKTISTAGSNKTETLSDTSHSEGELYVPSSGSYSLGEIRMLAKNCSDGENTNNCDDSVMIFVTKEMLTSWNESSKSLIQSMGQI